jgi:hypothetical protein
MQFFLKKIGIALGKQNIYDNKRLHSKMKPFLKIIYALTKFEHFYSFMYTNRSNLLSSFSSTYLPISFLN